MWNAGKKVTNLIRLIISCMDWHPTQTIRENKDGSIVLSFKTNHFFEVKRWVLSWGDGAKVLAPKELVEEVKQEIRDTARYYK